MENNKNNSDLIGTKYFFCERQLNCCFRCDKQCKYCKELDDKEA